MIDWIQLPGDRDVESSHFALSISVWRFVLNCCLDSLSRMLKMESEYGLRNVLVFTLSFMFGSVLILLLEIMKNFIKSKPPGRRLVSVRMNEKYPELWTVLLTGDCRCSCLPGHLSTSVVRSFLRHSHDAGSFQQFLILGNLHNHMADCFSHGKGFALSF